MRLSARRWLALAIVAVVVLDWASKFWVHNRMHLGSVRSLVDDWVWLNHRQNPGISGSLLADLPDMLRTPLLAGLALVGIVIVARLLRSTPDPLTRAGAALVLAGAVGNLGDRVLDGSVTDFIVVRYFPYVFNVADVAITLGALILAVRLARAVEPPEPVSPTPG